MHRRSMIVMVGALALATAVQAVAELPPLIPRETLFGNPDKASPQISPDGKRLAYIAPHAGVMNLWVRTIGKSDDRVVTNDSDRGIHTYFWAQNNDQLVYTQDNAGDENWHIHVVAVEGGAQRDLTPFKSVQARILAVDAKFPNDMLIEINDRDKHLHDVYRVNVVSGELTMVAENTDGFIGWTADHHFNVRGATKMNDDGGFTFLVRDGVQSQWRPMAKWGGQDALNSGPVAFTPDNTGIFVLSSLGTNTSELRQISLGTGVEKTLAKDRNFDVSSVMMHPTTHEIQAVGFNRERHDWKVIDSQVVGDFEALKKVRRGDFSIINRDRADGTWLVAYNTDDGPVHYYSYQRNTKRAELLFTNRSAMQGLKLAEMQPMQFTARDGLKIHAYLTLPVGVPANKLPTVLLVHGGPWHRDSWGYDSEAQWLANRGYAVFQVNFRGSTGYGKAHINAANKEWGRKMHHDLIDGVKWLVARGTADEHRVAIYGGSYGGYATLVGLTLTPKTFACGVDIVGPSNLVTWMNTIPAYWRPLEPILWDRVGHPKNDAEMLVERSPLFKINQIVRPLLIAQGKNDPRVPVTESQQIVAALQGAGKSVDYLEYEDEGHGFAKPENRLHFYTRAERFLADHIGGRYEQ